MVATSRTTGITGMKGVKDPVVAVALTNITLSGEQTVNGTAVVAGDRVLVTAQTSSVDNGVYDASATAWTRSKDFDGANDVEVGSVIVVADGNQYRVTAAGTIGTGAITFEHVAWQAATEFGATMPGTGTNGQVIAVIPMIRAITFDVDMALSQAIAITAATAETIFVLKKNGVQFGTVTFAIGGTVGTFAAAVPPAFIAGNYLSVHGPATADATLADVGFAFAAQVA